MNFDLYSHTILLTVAGSRAYGIHTDTSDVDLKGVAVPPAAVLLGCSSVFEQADKPSQIEPFRELLQGDEVAAARDTKLEGSVYALNKFCRLAMDGNPNILDALFCRDEDVRLATPTGRKLREHRKLFVSAKCKHTFSGYAFQQLERIKLHRRWLLSPLEREPVRKDFNLFEGINPNQVKAAMAAANKVVDEWELDLSRLDKSERVPVMQGVARYMAELSIVGHEKWKAAGRSIGYSENFLDILDRERRWKSAIDDWKKYQHWKKNRNPARAALEAEYGYDTKHGAHLYRLLKMAREILTTGEVKIWRDDREEILEVRAGGWPYERLVEWAEEEDRSLSSYYREKRYSIPQHPDRAAINTLCVELTETALRGQAG